MKKLRKTSGTITLGTLTLGALTLGTLSLTGCGNGQTDAALSIQPVDLASPTPENQAEAAQPESGECITLTLGTKESDCQPGRTPRGRAGLLLRRGRHRPDGGRSGLFLRRWARPEAGERGLPCDETAQQKHLGGLHLCGLPGRLGQERPGFKTALNNRESPPACAGGLFCVFSRGVSRVPYFSMTYRLQT